MTEPIKIELMGAYDSLSLAIKAAGLDLSQDEALAKSRISKLDDHEAMGVCYVSVDKSVFYTFTGPDGLVVLNRFDPFLSEITDNGFALGRVGVDQNNGQLKMVVTSGKAFTHCRNAMKMILQLAGTALCPAYAVTSSVLSGQ